MTQDMKHLYKKVSFLLLLMIFSSGVNKAWGQSEGLYYIDNQTGHSGATTGRYYLIPADAPSQNNKNDAFYSSDYNTQNGDSEKPFLTTYKTNKDKATVPASVVNNLPNNSVWILKAVTGESGYFYIIHASSGKYVVYEPPYPNNKPNRKSVHLLATDSPEENAKFEITTKEQGYNIRPKNAGTGNGDNRFLNPSGGNKDSYYGNGGNDSPAFNYLGLIGLWSGSDGNSIWYTESTHLAAPTISDVDDVTSKVTITDNNSLPSGYNVRYTFSSDGMPDDPTATSTIMTNGVYNVDQSGTLKVVIERYGVVLTNVATKAVEPVNTTPPNPTFTLSDDCNNEITISASGADIYYTTDGSEPSKTNGTLYSGPFIQNTSVTIKAVSYYGNNSSEEVITFNHTAKTLAPSIMLNGNTATISGQGNVYYTINGSDPTASSTLYSAPISVSGQVTIKAVAQEEGKSLSCVTTKTAKTARLISRASDLNSIQTDDNCMVMADFDAIGFDGGISNFSGTFDGGMFIISGLTKPLFNSVNGGTVKNVILKDIDISSGSTAGNVGAICNEATGASRIYNCGVLGTIKTTPVKDANGKIVSYEVEGSSKISGSNYVGSIVGLLDGTSRVINCYSYAVISNGAYVGGIVGYNNVSTDKPASATDGQKTMVMNCMYYGDITGGTSKAPIYNGEIITNVGKDTGVGNYNYFRAEARYVQDKQIDAEKYNCALAAEERFLNRFEFFRHLLNSNRALAAWWATGDVGNKDDMMKWELETADRSITAPNAPYPYPVLKPVFDNEGNYKQYPSVVNIDAAHVEEIDSKNVHYNEGRKLGNFTIYIKGVGSGAIYNAPNGASILKANGDPITDGSKREIPAVITDKDPERYNFNYYKVQLPYYNDYGTKNYTGNRVVTGWKIVEVSDGGSGTFSTASDDAMADNGVITSTPYNFADRKCSNKDLYSVSGRVFSQGAYYDVPEGVTSITIEPYWGQAVYVSDPYLDKVYNANMSSGYDVNIGGGRRYSNGTAYDINGDNTQKVYTSIANAVEQVSTTGSVYDNAIVLVGNTHNIGISLTNDTKSYTLMSIDLDNDHEPDYSYILRFNNRNRVHPVRVDFLNVIGLGMAQKSTGGSGTYNLGIMQPLGWFEVTNTGLFRVTQFEYDREGRTDGPMILHGGVIEQWVTVAETAGPPQPANAVTYYHVGSNVWFKEFHLGAHQDRQTVVTPHPPISVTGGDFDEFYLTGLYNTPSSNYDDNAECYINGGRFGRVAGTGMQGIGHATNHTNGNIIWQIDNADIDEFYAGGLNAAHIAEGNITTVISNSRVDLFCGGPKFGDMYTGRTVFTNATNCTFRTFFGAGYGGNSYNRKYPTNLYNDYNYGWNTWLGEQYTNKYDATYKGVEARWDYQFIPKSDNEQNVARLFIDYVSFSLATTHQVTTNLSNCILTKKELGRLKHNYCLGNFYGGGSLGKVDGAVNSTLTNCTVEGSVFGGGYSATLPTVSVTTNSFKTEPHYDEKLGAYLDPEYNDSIKCSWVHGNNNSLDIEKHIIYTTATLTGLGTVEGDITLTVDGDDTKIYGSVYGGGQDSKVDGSTNVTVTGGTIGSVWDAEKQRYQGGAYYGNVYGGGQGKWDDATDGLVTGNTNVTISGSPHIFHNVYGGGAFASVGTFTYDETLNIPTAATWADNTGICNVTITGGEFGWNGQDNGMICGASRGDDEHYYIYEKKEGAETGSYVSHATQVNKLAWVNRTNVIIGSTNSEDKSTILIKGSVYGGGENGHNLRDASVKIYKGTIGIADREENDSTDIVSGNITYKGPEYDNRGNVYGAGCGTDNYKEYVDGDDSKELLYTHYNPMAGIVCGNTKVEMLGGHVVRCIYGAGAMGSAGTFNIVNGKVLGMATGYETTGKSEVIVSGGQVGTTDMQMPDDWGYVFGGGKGKVLDPNKSNIENIQYVRETAVTISGNAFICGAVYGGAENGHVLGNTHVIIEGGQIGVGDGLDEPYEEKQFINPLTTEITNTNSLKECAHWVFDKDDPTTYDIYDLDGNGKPKAAKDGHTFYGNVFGGGSGYFPYDHRNAAELTALRNIDAGYADGIWLPSAGWVGGNTVVDITGGHILTSVYGGNECTDVDGTCTVNMSGGTVGVPRTKEQILAHPVTCNVFGAGKGDQRINFNQWTNVASTQVNITGGIIYGSVFGGGEDGHVIGDAETNISEGEGKTTIIGSVGTSGGDGNVYGGGRGFSESALTAGAVCGNVDLNISGGTMLGTVFGGGRLAPVGTHIVLAEDPNYGLSIEDGNKQVFGNKDIYKQLFNSDGTPKTNEERYPADVPADETTTHGHITINISGGTIGSDKMSDYSLGDVFGGCKGTLNSPLPFGLSKSTKVTVSGETTQIYGTVYGGGEAGEVEKNVEVNINGGTIKDGVYGGGALASTNTKWTDADGQRYDTKMNLHGGVITGNVFGGGLGRKEKGAEGQSGYISPIAAIVGGDVTVELNNPNVKDEEGHDYANDCIVNGKIFGCNNLNGTPRGNVTVHVYKTNGDVDKSSGIKNNQSYDLEAVYGGGNEAAYVPRDTYSYNEETGIYTYPQIADDATDKSKTNVIIDGCDLSSIEYVYGGGNSAPTPATSVTVNECYEIGTVFGGGNGADDLSDGTPNLGANVGYRNYSYFVDRGAEANPRYNVYDYDGTYPEGSPYATAATVENRRTHYKYGTGRAETKLYGGTIHNAFGGSNTLGNVCAVAFSVIDQGNDCSLNVGQIYGAGNKAKMDARIELNLGCITGFNELFGGAFDADINENVKLEVTSGTYGSVYGGNNKGGHINGTITVEVNETGCHPVEIGSLYGGGKDADYIAPADHQDSPTVKVISATKIDKIYGGGCNADVTGNPTVEINMIPGTLYKGVSGKETPQELGTIGTVFGGGYNGKVIGDTKVLIGTKDKDDNNNPVSAHITGSVYGGGENANVEGKTEVVIGKAATE